MPNLDALKVELDQGLKYLSDQQETFANNMLTQIEKAEQSLILESLERLHSRVGRIEEKLAENNMDKEEPSI